MAVRLSVHRTAAGGPPAIIWPTTWNGSRRISDRVSRIQSPLLTTLPASQRIFRKQETSKQLIAKRLDGRGDKIRTCDFYVPNVALYQAEPHPVIKDKRRIIQRFVFLTSQSLHFYFKNLKAPHPVEKSRLFNRAAWKTCRWSRQPPRSVIRRFQTLESRGGATRAREPLRKHRAPHYR
jgi:hypothetical protein